MANVLGIIRGKKGESGTKLFINDVESNKKEVYATSFGVSGWGKIMNSPITESYKLIVYKNIVYAISISGKVYKLTKHKWELISETPYVPQSGFSLVIYNNELHMLGGSYPNETKHYAWNGSSWRSISTLPYTFNANISSAVVFNNEIHILGSLVVGEMTKHYAWNGSSWRSVSTLPYKYIGGATVVFNNKIHILGNFTDSNTTRHYEWNGSSWSSATSLPFSTWTIYAVASSSYIYIFGGYDKSNYKNLYNYYIFDGTSWTKRQDIRLENPQSYLLNNGYLAYRNAIDKLTTFYTLDMFN